MRLRSRSSAYRASLYELLFHHADNDDRKSVGTAAAGGGGGGGVLRLLDEMGVCVRVVGCDMVVEVAMSDALVKRRRRL